jgi:hypothetical protein
LGGEVERLEAWQLAAYVQHLAQRGVTEVTWNKERLELAEAGRRAQSVSDTATVVVDGATIYVAEPDHSPDAHVPGGPGHVPLQIQPRRPRA